MTTSLSAPFHSPQMQPTSPCGHERGPLAVRSAPAKCAVPNRPDLAPARPRLGFRTVRRPLAPLLLAGLGLLAACDTEGGASSPVEAAVQLPPASPEEAREARTRVAELIEVLEPIDPLLTSDKQDEIFLRQVTLISELKESERAVGLEALRVLRDEGSEVVNLERALLEIAAYSAPEDTLPLLETLIEEYGPALYLRAEAARLIGETSPERALEVLAPWLQKTKPGKTMPPMEFLVMGYVSAADQLGVSPVEVLSDVATNLYMEESARHRAVRELGKYDEPLAVQALLAILTESTGNAYMRRIAVQGLVRRMPREEACQLFFEIADREADLNFARFLADVLDKNCR